VVTKSQKPKANLSGTVNPVVAPRHLWLCLRHPATKYPHGELLKMNQQYGYAPPGFMNNMLSAAQQCRKQ
jgi:hypothetical protein